MPTVICPSCDEKISVEDLSGTYTCPECNEEFDVEEAEEVDEDEIEVKEAQKSGGSIWGTIIFIIIVFFLYKWLSGPKWTLMVCDELLSPPYRYECQGVAYVFENTYKSLDECWSAGTGYMSNYPGFECGYKCKYDSSWGSWVCDRINE